VETSTVSAGAGVDVFSGMGVGKIKSVGVTTEVAVFEAVTAGWGVDKGAAQADNKQTSKHTREMANFMGPIITEEGRFFFPRLLEKRYKMDQNLHRKDAKDAKKKRKKKADFIAKNGIIPLAFVFLCVLRVFAVQIF
jgi:hypothetical protein